MDLNDLNAQLQIYRNALNKVREYRTEWKDVKPLIYDTLNKIVSQTEMKAEVLKEEKVDGMEIVYLTFGKRNSGIAERIEDADRPYIKEGGFLFYTQIYNGKISVWMSQPVINGLTTAKSPKAVDVYVPSDISEELIIEHVTNFIKEMAKWEDLDLEHQEIGYKIRSKKEPS